MKQEIILVVIRPIGSEKFSSKAGHQIIIKGITKPAMPTLTASVPVFMYPASASFEAKTQAKATGGVI